MWNDPFASDSPFNGALEVGLADCAVVDEYCGAGAVLFNQEPGRHLLERKWWCLRRRDGSKNTKTCIQNDTHTPATYMIQVIASPFLADWIKRRNDAWDLRGSKDELLIASLMGGILTICLGLVEEEGAGPGVVWWVRLLGQFCRTEVWKPINKCLFVYRKSDEYYPVLWSKLIFTHHRGAPCHWCAAGTSQCPHSGPLWWWWDTPQAPLPSCGLWDSPRERCSRTPSLPSLASNSPTNSNSPTGSHTTADDHSQAWVTALRPLQLLQSLISVF